jgi:hypothetical protein
MSSVFPSFTGRLQGVFSVAILSSSVKLLAHLPEKPVCLSKTSAGLYRDQQTRRSLPEWRSCCSCKKISNVPVLSSWNLTRIIRMAIDSRFTLLLYISHVRVYTISMLCLNGSHNVCFTVYQEPLLGALLKGGNAHSKT